jgi:translation initiation factor 2 beta subunit (eIF-2beta)/eIF-5
MVQSYLAGLKGKSIEETVNNVIDMHIKKFVIILRLCSLKDFIRTCYLKIF